MACRSCGVGSRPSTEAAGRGTRQLQEVVDLALPEVQQLDVGRQRRHAGQQGADIDGLYGRKKSPLRIAKEAKTKYRA